MARRQYFVLGPNFNDDKLISDQTDPVNDYTFPTTTDVSGLSPIGSNRWMRINPGSTISLPHHKGENITAENYSWLVISSLVKEGIYQSDAFYINTTSGLLKGRMLFGATTWQLSLLDNNLPLLTSSASFAKDSQQVKIWIQMDGTTITLRIDGSIDSTASYTGKLNNTSFNTPPAGIDGSTIVYMSGIGLFGGDTESDRPGFEMETELIEANGDYTTDQDYGNLSNCGSTAGTYTDVTLSSLTVDTSSAFCEQGGSAGLQGVETETPSMTNIEGICVRFAARANVAGKSVFTYTKIIDALSNEIEKMNSNLNHTAYIGHTQSFDSPPTGSWDAMIAGLKVSVRSLNTNGANDAWAGFCVEVGKPTEFTEVTTQLIVINQVV